MPIETPAEFIAPRLHYALYVLRPDNQWAYVAGHDNFYRLRDIAADCYGPNSRQKLMWPIRIVEFTNPEVMNDLQSHFKPAEK